MVRATKVFKDAPRGFHYSWFNFSSMEPIYNGRFEQPDAYAGFAWLQYAAYRKFHDAKCLEGADGAMQALVAEPKNPYYECLLPFGEYTAAGGMPKKGATTMSPNSSTGVLPGRRRRGAAIGARSSVVGASMTFRA